MSGYVPKRGDIVWLTFTPHAGREQSGRRPALIVSPDDYNATVGLALACPITSKVKGYPFEVHIHTPQINGVSLADHIKNVDWRARNAEFIERADDAILREVLAKIAVLLR